MKQIHRFAHSVVASAVALVVIAFATQATAQTPVVAPATSQVTAKVVGVRGNARYSIDNKKWQTIQKGDTLKAGAVIQTAEKSSVDIVICGSGESVQPLANRDSLVIPEEESQNVVRIFENTVLGIDKLTSERTGVDEVSETQLDLRAGEIMGNVKKLSAASKYEVKVPNGVAGIRGTVYHIAASGVVNVLTGSVVIAVVDKDGSVVTRVVLGGFRYDPASDRISPIPKPQLDKLKGQYLGGLPTPPTTYTKDHTIIYVSPNGGGSGNSQGQNNNNQGGGGNNQGGNSQ
jgi:FecR protein